MAVSTRTRGGLSYQDLYHQLRQAEPFRTGGWSDRHRGERCADALCIYWRLARQPGRRLRPHAAAFACGVLALERQAEAKAPARDGLRQGLDDVRVIAAAVRLREQLGPRALPETVYGLMETAPRYWNGWRTRLARWRNKSRSAGLWSPVRSTTSWPPPSRGDCSLRHWRCWAVRCWQPCIFRHRPKTWPRPCISAPSWWQSGDSPGAAPRAADVPNKEELLAGVPIFAELERRDIRKLAALCLPKDFPAGTNVVEEGAAGLRMYVITGGRAEICTGEAQRPERCRQGGGAPARPHGRRLPAGAPAGRRGMIHRRGFELHLPMAAESLYRWLTDFPRLPDWLPRPPRPGLDT